MKNQIKKTLSEIFSSAMLYFGLFGIGCVAYASVDQLQLMHWNFIGLFSFMTGVSLEIQSSLKKEKCLVLK